MPESYKLKNVVPTIANEILTMKQTLAEQGNINNSNHQEVWRKLQVLQATVDQHGSDLKHMGTNLKKLKIISTVSFDQTEELQDLDVNGAENAVGSSNERNSSFEGTATSNSNVHQYKLSRQIVTMKELWNEWTLGINGSPSVLQLNQQFKTKWRTNATETKFYSRRLLIINGIKSVASRLQITENEALDRCELMRVEKNRSLGWLGEQKNNPSHFFDSVGIL